MKTAKSQKELARARALFPGGVNSPVRAFRAVGGEPLFIARGEGAHLVDVDGNHLVDYVLSWGPLLAGHAHPEIVRAVTDAAAQGTSFGAPTPRESDLAEKVRALVPSMKRMRFVSSGTEATSAALRVARGFTGRERIEKFEGCYHGATDSRLVKAGSGVETPGLPVGAYGGREDVLAQVAPEGPIYQAGTLSGNPIAMAAGCAMLDLVRQRGFTEQIEKRAEELCGQLREACAAARVPAQVNQAGSMWTLFFASSEVSDYPSAKRSDLARFAAVHRALLERGVYLPPSQFEAAFLSSEHGTEEIDQTVVALRETLRAA